VRAVLQLVAIQTDAPIRALKEEKAGQELARSSASTTRKRVRILRRSGAQQFCKLKGLRHAFGKSDGFALIEAPDTVTGASLAIAISASGAFSKFETTVLITQDELLKALEKAQDVEYVAPGVAVHA
jgi:uncharacterized protein with GYD domain